MPALIFTIHWYMLVTAKAVTALARSAMQYADTAARLAPEVHLKKKKFEKRLM